MKDNMIKDERIIAQLRKIQSEAWQILVLALFISVLVQQFLFKAPFSQFAVEFFCALGICIYVKIRNLSSGIDIVGADKNSNKKILITGLIAGVVFIITFAVLSGETDFGTMALSFLGFFAAYCLVNYIMRYVTKRRLKQIDDKLNDDEAEETNE